MQPHPFLPAALAVLCISVMASLQSGCSPAPADSSREIPGEKTYQRFCFSCHQAGINGAPRLGDAAAWAELSAKGKQALLQGVIQGIPPGMPRKGMCIQCSDQELEDAIDYMITHSQ